MGSVTRWVDDLARGERREEAAGALAGRYFDQIVRYATAQLPPPGACRGILDGEDAAVHAFDKVFRGIEEGRLKLTDRGDLVGLLRWSAKGVLVNRQGNPCVVNAGDVALWDAETGVGHKKYCPDALVEAKDACRRLLGLLDEGLRQIALLKVVGHTNEEIATKIDRSVATVERKLDRIRSKWSRFDHGPPGVGRPPGQGGPPADVEIVDITIVLDRHQGLSEK